ncbi:Arc/MetJ-type ribon-helix-helix transcriptional regulator [Streptosporangium becharense]|uniref:Arc/MetJ-type ribon-helix-helix transcriptional regulator n=1 Tax=Streptosporangium becharense TaxID=1816182 RepID=A0A7W9IE42_9ACTN|nr:Arc/MetJ-type ribon-helix-helix transcriptional regulator [Streptosporangium becharense]MBB5819047.1 Arc/MetJ-type ribon-helix-helix transcriptional regulator [Streptosporangium becharense]
MTVSITLSPQDAFFLEEHVSRKHAGSRSAAVREAIRLLRQSSREDRTASSPSRERECGAPP